MHMSVWIMHSLVFVPCLRARTTFSRCSTPRLAAADASAQQQQQQPSVADPRNSGETSAADATGDAPALKEQLRRVVAPDGTLLVFRPPSTQDLHKLQLGDWVARKDLALALVALSREEGTEDGKDAAVGAPLAGAVVEAMEGGGSSVATRVCLLRHRRLDGVSEAVEHALLDETINQFLNDGSRISQVSPCEFPFMTSRVAQLGKSWSVWRSVVCAINTFCFCHNDPRGRRCDRYATCYLHDIGLPLLLCFRVSSINSSCCGLLCYYCTSW